MQLTYNVGSYTAINTVEGLLNSEGRQCMPPDAASFRICKFFGFVDINCDIYSTGRINVRKYPYLYFSKMSQIP